MVGLDADGRAQMTAVTAANVILGGIFKRSGAINGRYDMLMQLCMARRFTDGAK
jgi:hypothetical protein